MTTAPIRFLHVSNAVTYVSLAAALAAIVTVPVVRSWSLAGALIAVSALADIFDGAFARLFARTEDEQRFGVHLDSLVDALAFGLAPVACLAVLLRVDSLMAGIACGVAGFCYVLAAVTRLGFYNVMHDRNAAFVGVPTTVAGLLWSSIFAAQPSAAACGVLLIVLAAAMIAPVTIARPRGSALATVAAWAVALLVLHARTGW